MSNQFPIKENVYLVLLQYFDGKIENINKKTLKELLDQKYKGKEIDPVDKKAMTVMKKILKMKKKTQVNMLLSNGYIQIGIKKKN